MKKFTQKKILATISLIIIATFSVIASMAFAVNPNSGTLQGSTITVEITNPADGTNVQVPTGAINVEGTITITNSSIPSRPDLDDQKPSINGLSLNHTTSTGTSTIIDLIGGGYFDETTNNFAVPLNVDCDSNLIEVTVKVWGYWPWLQDDHRLNLTSSITVIGDCEVAEPAIDIEKYTRGEIEPVWICELDKPQVLTMLYTGDNVQNHNQDPRKVKVEGDPGFAPVVHIIAADKKLRDLHRAKIFFEGDVPLGGIFGIDATAAGEGKLRADTYVHIFDPAGELLQTIKFHTSCSQPLALGDEFGGVQVVGFIGEHGATAGLLPP